MGSPARTGRRRRWPWVLAVLALLLGATVWWLARLLEPQRLAALLLERASDASGLALATSGQAGVGLWPDLHVSLAGLSATAPAANAPMFTARRLDLVLPWSALLDREPVLQRLRLVGPLLQRDALQRWLDSLPARAGAAASMRLPELTAGIAIEDGTVVGDVPDAWSLLHLSLDTSPLITGQAFEATMDGVLTLDGDRHALGLSLATVPRSEDGVLLLDPLQLTVRMPQLADPLDLEGRGEVLHPQRLALELSGRLRQWPHAAIASLPAGELPLDFRLAYEGPTDLSAPITLDAGGAAGSRLELQATVAELLAWRAAQAPSPLPPVAVRLATPRLDVGGAMLTGVELRTTGQAPGADAGNGGTEQP